MRRREVVTLLGGAAAWPLAARGQQSDRVRRIGVLLPATADDAVFQTRMAAFLQALALLGWIVGRNLNIDIRWATSNAADIRRHAAELVALAPDVILANGTPAQRCEPVGQSAPCSAIRSARLYAAFQSHSV